MLHTVVMWGSQKQQFSAVLLGCIRPNGLTIMINRH